MRVLLCPIGSNVVIRTASCSVGVILPVYSTFKAIERRDQDEQQKWLMYWAAYGSFSMVELFTDKLLHWFPLYYHVKFAFLVWLQLPCIDGAKMLYMNHLRPFLLEHQTRLDQIIGFLYGEMSRFVCLHQEEFQFVKTMLMKVWVSGTSSIRPGQGQASGVIEGRNGEANGQASGAIEGQNGEANSESGDD